MFSVNIIDDKFEDNRSLLNQMFQQRYDTYCLEHEFSEGDVDAGIEVDEYDLNQSCAYFIIIEDGYLAASSRLIINNHGLTLPIINEEFELDEPFQEDSAEISRFIVNKDKRKHPKYFYTTTLGYNMYVYVKERQIEFIYALMEEEILNFIRERIGCEFRRIGKPKFCMGGLLIPSRLKVSEVSIFG